MVPKREILRSDNLQQRRLTGPNAEAILVLMSNLEAFFGWVFGGSGLREHVTEYLCSHIRAGLS